MKNSAWKGWTLEGRKQFVYFYAMCSERDRAFFDGPAEQRKAEDFVRLMYIAFAFGMRDMALRILANTNNDEEFDKCLKATPKKGPTTLKWVDDFISEIPMPELKKIVLQLWEPIRSKINPEEFESNSLF